MRTPFTRVLVALAGYVVGALLHGIWNLSAVTGTIVTVYLFFQIPLFVAFLVLLVLLRLREGRLMRLYLSQYADAGWLTHQEVEVLSSVSLRRQARMWARQQGGRPAATALHGFQDTASDLALLRARMNRGTAERDAPQHERDLLVALVGQRRAYVDRLVLAHPQPA